MFLLRRQQTPLLDAIIIIVVIIPAAIIGVNKILRPGRINHNGRL